MQRAATANELSVQFIVWLSLTLLLALVGFMLYHLGLRGIAGWVIYGLVFVLVPLFVAASICVAAEW